jgi:cell division protein FtsW (lipid II flippase)
MCATTTVAVVVVLLQTLLGRSSLASALSARVIYIRQLRAKWCSGSVVAAFAYLHQLMIRGGGTLEAETEQWTIARYTNSSPCTKC